MTIQEVGIAVAILVGLTTIAGVLIAIGKGWALISQADGKLNAVHSRIDKLSGEVRGVGDQVLQIRTFLAIHPTLRFKLPAPTPPGGQDVFAPGEE